MDTKPFNIRFNKIDGFIRYSLLFGPETYDAIYNRIRYLISLKSGITYIFLSLLPKNQSLLV